MFDGKDLHEELISVPWPLKSKQAIVHSNHIHLKLPVFISPIEIQDKIQSMGISLAWLMNHKTSWFHLS